MKTFMKYFESTQLTEKLITFANKAYPTSGHVVIMAGGAGSGKGFVVDKLIGIEGKTFDVDALKELAMKTPFIINQVKKEMGIDISELDLKNPDNTNTLHQIIGKTMKLPKKTQMAFFTSVLKSMPKNKPNIIFDVTLKDLQKLQNIVYDVTKLGYEKKNIHIVWVINEIGIAQKQNAERPRQVDPDILINTHIGAAQTMRQIVDMGPKIKKFMDGDIVFAFNQIKVDSALVKSKKGGEYIKDANYVYIKRSGKPTMKIDDITAGIINKIASYVPDAKYWNK